MSYINEALKKAQKEKDVLYRKYFGIVSTAGSKAGPFSGKVLWWGSFALILLAFVAYLWLPSSNIAVSKPRPEATPQPKSLEPENAGALYEKARLLYKTGRLKEAKRLYEKTLGVDPNHLDALNNLGVIHIQDKNYSLAESKFQKAIALKPDYVNSHYNLACLHALKGNVSQSLIHLKKAVSLDQSVKQWARVDEDLKNLRRLPEFKKTIESS